MPHYGTSRTLAQSITQELSSIMLRFYVLSTVPEIPSIFQHYF